MQKLILYPTNVGIFQVSDENLRSNIKQLFHRYNNLEKWERVGFLSTRDKGFNIWNVLDDHSSMSKLESLFLRNTMKYLKDFYDLDVDISELEMLPGWLNIDWREKPEVPRGKGGYRFHHHLNPVNVKGVGGVYYISAEDIDSGHFSILDPRSRDEDHYKYSPKSGEMIIFPDWMMHRPEVSNSSLDNPRLSIATNIYFKFQWPKELIW